MMQQGAMAYDPLGTSEMARCVRAHDWAATPLGAIETWPERITAVVELVLASPLVSAVALLEDRLLIYNDAAARLYGDRHPGALGCPLASSFPDSYPGVAALYDRVFAGESVRVAGQALTVSGAGGGEVFDAYLTPVRDAAGAVVGAHMVGLEIGGRLRAHAALQESEARYRTLFGEIDSGFCIIDMIFDQDGRATDYCFVEANPAFERQSGLIDAVGRCISEFAPDLEEHWFERYGRVALTGEPMRIEGEVAPLGRWFDINAFRIGTPEQRRVGVLFTDITQRRNIEKSLRESEARQAFLLNLSDALRPLMHTAHIKAEAMRLLGGRLGAIRAQYWDVEPDGQHFVSDGGYAEGMARIAGRLRIADFGAHVEEALTAGRTLTSADVANDPRVSSSELASYEALGVAAYLVVPLVKNGRLVAALGLSHEGPHDWMDEEIGLAEETAERTWAAVERAQTEAALSETEERLRQFAELSQDVLWIRDAETFQWEYLTPAFETIYGLTRESALRGDNMTGWLELIVPEDREHAARSLARVRDGEWVTFQFRFRRPSDGGIRYMRNTDFPIRDSSGKVVRIGGIGHDITPLKETEQALAAAEESQRALIEGIPQLVWRAIDGGVWTWASPQWTAFTGQTDADSQGFGWLDVVHPGDRAGVEDIWKGAIERGEFRADYRIRHHETGRYRWFQTRATPVKDRKGTIVGWLGTSTDVDDLRGLQERQQILLAELQHRVRNILAIIRSIMRRSLDGAQSLQDYAQHLDGRVAALARTQVLLTRFANADVDLEELIRDELIAQTADDSRIDFSGADINLPPKAAEVLALAMHELATNSVKYGAIAHPDASLRIEWRVEERDEGRWLIIIWTERGVPMAGGPPARTGFGTELITRRVPYELKGHGELAIKPGGIVCTIAFPLIECASILETDSAADSTETGHDAIGGNQT